MKSQRLGILAAAVVLAAGSFAFARYDYQSKNSTTLTNPFNRNQSRTFAWGDQKLFGDWMKDEVVFAIVVPVALIAGGAVLALKK